MARSKLHRWGRASIGLVSGGIYLIGDDDQLVEMLERPYDSEAVLQQLLAKHPSLLAGDQLGHASPRRWLLIAREASLPSEVDGGGRWSVDHLFFDQDAIPTLVEVKRSTDTRIRREVVGQMLDYAANAVVYWPIERLRAVFEARCAVEGHDPDDVVLELLGGEGTPESFWEDAQTNLGAGKVRLVFVADVIPVELRRVIEFLNVQMSPADVMGIEIRQYVGEGLRTLVPAVVGQTAEAQQRKAVGASGPRRADWSWAVYEDELAISPEKVAVGHALVAAVEQALSARGLNWEMVYRKGYLAFQRTSGYNVVLVDLYWRKTPRLAVRIPKSPSELGLISPYPDLAESWDGAGGQWGWTVPTQEQIPDVGSAIDLVLPFHAQPGPMVVPE